MAANDITLAWEKPWTDELPLDYKIRRLIGLFAPSYYNRDEFRTYSRSKWLDKVGDDYPGACLIVSLEDGGLDILFDTLYRQSEEVREMQDGLREALGDLGLYSEISYGKAIIYRID